MKRFALALAMLGIATLLSGCCSLLSGALNRSRPQPPIELSQPSDLPVATIAAAAEPTEASQIHPKYTSTSLGITFTMPDSWADKYRVEEGDGYLCVYFKPAETIEEGMGKFFTIIKKTSEEDEGFFDNEATFEANGTTYLYGMPTDVAYMEENPEYETYVKMRQDLPAIFESILAAQ